MANSSICRINGCGKPIKVKSHRLCNSHYKRFLRHGNPLAGQIPNGEARRFLNDEVIPHNADECLIWPYGKTQAGYGVIRLNDVAVLVHIYVCTEIHGPKPKNGRYEVAHSCGNPSCCASKHLRWATPYENAMDKRKHGTMPRGQKHHWARLTDEEADVIISMKGRETSDVVADRFNVTKQYVKALWAGTFRAHQSGHHD